MTKQLIDPASDALHIPSPDTPALAGLPIYEGFTCLSCTYAAGSGETMRVHIRKNHPEQLRKGGSQSKALGVLAQPRWKPATCQRFFTTGAGSLYFVITSPAQLQEEEQIRQRRSAAQGLPKADFIRLQIDALLEEGLQEARVSKELVMDNATKTEVSPWLEMTRWPRYLQGLTFGEVASLALPVHSK